MARTTGTDSYDQLKTTWQNDFGISPPKNLSRRLMQYAAAYEKQASHHGGLGADLKRQLSQLASPQSPTNSAPTLAIGTRLVREWNGNTHVVDVVEGGFLLGKRHFTSLSAIANAITGAHWNGVAFFGLKKRRKQKDKRSSPGDK